LAGGLVDPSVGAHALVAAGCVNTVQVGFTRRVQTLVHVHALAPMTQLPETFGTATVAAGGSAVLRTLKIRTDNRRRFVISYIFLLRRRTIRRYVNKRG